MRWHSLSSLQRFLGQGTAIATAPFCCRVRPEHGISFSCLSMGMLGLLEFHVSFTKPGTPTSFHPTRRKWQQLGSWRIQNVNINCGMTQRQQSFAARNLLIWFGQFGKHFHQFSVQIFSDTLYCGIKEATMQTSTADVRSPLQSFLSPKMLAWLWAMKLHIAWEKRNEKVSNSLVLSSLRIGSLHQPQATLYCSVPWKLYERNSFGKFRIPWILLVLEASVMLSMSFGIRCWRARNDTRSEEGGFLQDRWQTRWSQWSAFQESHIPQRKRVPCWELESLASGCWEDSCPWWLCGRRPKQSSWGHSKTRICWHLEVSCFFLNYGQWCSVYSRGKYIKIVANHYIVAK